MFFAEVTFLMRDGLRLKPAERQPPIRGTMTILESDRARNNSKRNLTHASLYIAYGTAQMASRGDLIDPVIRPYNGPGFLLSGTQLRSEFIDGELRIFEHRQVWHVVPTERQPGE